MFEQVEYTSRLNPESSLDQKYISAYRCEQCLITSNQSQRCKDCHYLYNFKRWLKLVRRDKISSNRRIRTNGNHWSQILKYYQESN